MWTNAIRVRTLCLLHFGHDMDAVNVDQKPMHLNESGSKNSLTTALTGEKQIAIKEVTSETRARWTVNTVTVSNKHHAAAVPPVECLFKGGNEIAGKLERFLPSLALAGLSVQTSDSGSYRMEHVLNFMDAALRRPVGDDGRWRLLFLDCYRAHEGDAILRLAWKHRYVVVIHGGGTTGVCQVNDTHLHAALSREYIELEEIDQLQQLRSNAYTCPRRTREDCLRDLALVWRRPHLHLAAAKGFWQNHLLTHLDGVEDHLVTTEVAGFWIELKMDVVRAEAIQELCRDFEAGFTEWSFEHVYALVSPFPGRGHMDHYEFGQEDEGADVGPQEHVWDDRDQPSPAHSDDEAARAPVAIVCLTDVQAREAADHEKRLAALDRVAEAAADRPRHLMHVISSMRDHVMKEACGRRQNDAVVAAALQRHDRRRAGAAAQDDERRRAADASRIAQQIVVDRVSAAMDARLLDLQKRERAVVEQLHQQSDVDVARRAREAIEAASRSFTAADLGQGQGEKGVLGERYRRNRFELLQRVARLGDALPADVEADWNRWQWRFDLAGCRQYAGAWGSELRNLMAAVVRDLLAGDAAAFLSFHRRYTRRWVLKGELVVPGASLGAAA